MIDAEVLAQMKSTAFLINTSRGKIVNQTDLYDALSNKTIRGAALDVFEDEPIPSDDPLLKLDNLIVTPHIGNATLETRSNMSMTAARNLELALNGEKPLYSLGNNGVE